MKEKEKGAKAVTFGPNCTKTIIDDEADAPTLVPAPVASNGKQSDTHKVAGSGKSKGKGKGKAEPAIPTADTAISAADIGMTERVSIEPTAATLTAGTKVVNPILTTKITVTARTKAAAVTTTAAPTNTTTAKSAAAAATAAPTTTTTTAITPTPKAAATSQPAPPVVDIRAEEDEDDDDADDDDEGDDGEWEDRPMMTKVPLHTPPPHTYMHTQK